MSGRARNARISDKIYQTSPSIRQQYFPAPNRTIRARALACSSVSKRQQTITQMDPFHSIFHPHSDQENLDYEAETEDSHEDFAPRPKRRKTLTDEIPIRRVTRSATKKMTASTPKVKSEAEETGASGDRSVRRIPPPETTPKRFRPTEIPCSQSPANSLLLTQSRRSLKDVYRSPLKDRSANVVPIRSPINDRRRRWASKRKMMDSMEEDDCETSNTSQKTRKSSQSTPRRTINSRPEDDKPSAPIGAHEVPQSQTTSYQENPFNHHISSQSVPDSQQASYRHRTAFPPTLQPEPSPPQTTIETESQFENAWHSYHGPQSSTQIPSSLPCLSSQHASSTSEAERQHESPKPHLRPKLPTSSPTEPAKTPLKQRKTPLVPPSQASTVDVTQSPPRRRTRSSSQPLPASVLEEEIASSPPIPPQSEGRQKDDEWQEGAIYLTDSQLLPASLMEDSLPAPPPLLDWKDLEEEDEA